jgi:hypothetical protein
MDRERMQRCLEQVAAYRASGQKADVWARANGVELRALSSWCAHARRWQARLDGVTLPRAAEPAGFVAARVAATAARAGASETVRIELQAGATRIELHWPLAATRELAAWLHEVGR